MPGMQSLSNVRNELLDLHRALIDAQRADYERERGRVAPGEFLQTLISDPSYAWLQPLTGLVARLDEVLADETLQQRYLEALQRHPEVLVAHGKLKQALSEQ